MAVPKKYEEILHLHIYTGGMFKACPKLINNIEQIGHLVVYVLNIYNFHMYELLQNYYHYTHFTLKKSPHAFYGLLLVSVCMLHLCMLRLHFHTQWYLDYG